MESSFLRAGALRAGASGAVAVAVTATLAACGAAGDDSASSAGGKPPCPVRALMVTNVTGAGSANGEAGSAGAKAAVETINKGGGVMGCDVKLDIRDDGSDYTKSLPLVQSAMSKTDYGVVVPADFGAATVAPYLTRQKQFAIVVSGAKDVSDVKINPNVFDTVPPAGLSTAALAKYAVARGYKKFAVVADNTTTGKATVEGLRATAKEVGATVVATERVDLSSVNMAPAVSRVKRSGADALILTLFGPPAGYFLRDKSTAGLDVPVFGTGSVMATNLAKVTNAQNIDDITVAGSAGNTAPSTAGGDKLIQQLEAAGVQIDQALALYAQPHDALLLWAWAANKAKSLDTAKLTATLESSGSEPIPGLALADVSGYTSEQHFWAPPKAVAIAKHGTYDDGRLARIQYGDEVAR